MNRLFSGVYTQLVTPFHNGLVDLAALERLTLRQQEVGVFGLVVFSVVGEGMLLTMAERQQVLTRLAAICPDNFPLIVDCTAVSLTDVRHHIDAAAAAGARAALIAPPPWLLPTMDGRVAFFSTLADVSALPILLHHAPARTGCPWTLSSVVRLSHRPRIIGFCDAASDIALIQQIRQQIPDRFELASAVDTTSLAMLMTGCGSVFSTSANVIPEHWKALYACWKAGDARSADQQMTALSGFLEAVCETGGPEPIKAALALLGLCSMEVRLPGLCSTQTAMYRIAAEMDRLGLSIQNGVPI